MAKKKKFDTNPLDPSFPERVQKEAETVALPKNQFKTAEFPPPSVTEEETRRFENHNFNQYQSPYNGQTTPAEYQTAKFTGAPRTIPLKNSKSRLPERWLMGLAYIPWYPGLIAALIMLFIVPKSETKIRFHAAQGLAAHIGILIVSAILSTVGNVTDLADMANWIFKLVTSIMLVIFTVKAWQGKPIHIESVDDLTNWLEEKIKPRN
jgi:uncharacterized membrane protein